MTVVLLLDIMEKIWKQRQSHLMKIRMPAGHKIRKMHTSVMSRYYWVLIRNQANLGKPKKLKSSR